MKKKLDGNYTRILRAILNKSWRQHPTKQQLCGHISPITKTTKVRRTRRAGHCWRSKDELISDVLQWTPSHGRAKAGRPASTYNSSVPIQDVDLKTYRKRWTIEKGGGRGSGRSVLMARHDDDDEGGFFFFLYGVVCVWWSCFFGILVCRVNALFFGVFFLFFILFSEVYFFLFFLE